MRRKTMWAALFLCLVIGFFPTWANDPYEKARKKFGEIFIGSPEVATRERLVNDRLAQDAWLRARLEKSDAADFDSFQGLEDFRSLVGLSARASAHVDPNQGAIYDARTRAYLADLEREQRLAALEHRIAAAEQLQRLRQLNGKNADANGAAETEEEEEEPAEPAQPPGAPQAFGNGVDDALLDAFYKRLTTESFDKGLADPSGIGTTKAKGTPIDRLRDQLAYREEIRNEILENQLDDRHDLHGRSLYRFNIDTTLLPRRGVGAWAVVEVDVTDGSVDYASLYDDWRRHLEREIHQRFFRLREDSEHCIDFGSDTFFPAKCRLSPEDQEALARYFYACLAKTPGEIDWTSRYCPSPEKYEGDRVASLQRLEEEVSSVSKRLRQESRTELINPFDKIDLSLLAALNAGFKTIVFRIDEKAKPEKEIAMWAHFLLRYSALEVVGDRELDTPEEGYLVVEIDPDSTLLKEVKCEEPEKGRQNFEEALRSKSHVYAYAATPKESVQRISRVSSQRRALELSAMLSGVQNGMSAEAMANFVNQSQELLNGISRQPLVVGYTSSVGRHGDTCPPNGNSANGNAAGLECARLGWIIGPKFELRRRGAVPALFGAKGYRHSHVPIQNSVAGTISVPGWWDRVNFDVEAKWQKPGGGRSQTVSEGSHTVDLPARLESITDALSTRRQPRVRFPDRRDFVSGQSARLLLRGENLWRSTQVTLGAQRADKIEVLPSMTGIIASFEPVTEPASRDGSARTVPIRVWTSEGYQRAGDAEIWPPPKKKKTEVAVDFNVPRLVGADTVTLKIVKGSLPSGYADLQMGLRQRNEKDGGYSGWVYAKAVPPAGHLQQIAATFSADQLASFSTGSKLQAGVFLRLNPASPTAELVALSPGHAILYKTPAESQIAVSPVSVKAGKAVTFTFPKAAAYAFPGFDPNTVKVVAVATPPIAISLMETGRSGEGDEQGPVVWKARVEATSLTAKKKFPLKLEKAVPGLDFAIKELEVSP